jgi:hypothetical protein
MNTDELVAHGRSRFEHAAARRTLKEKYQAKLTFGWNGGMFKATPEMITFLSLYGGERIVILDLYETPVEVNAKELCELMKPRLQEQMNAWLVEHHELNKNR